MYRASSVASLCSSLQVAHEAVHKEKCVQSKQCSVDLVTETDKKVEDLIMSTLKKEFPNHK